MTNRSIEQYDYLRRLDAVCDLFLAALDTGAQTPEELFALLPDLLPKLPEYHQAILPQIQPEIIAAGLKPKNRNGVATHLLALKQYLTDLTGRIDQGQPIVSFFAPMTPEIFLGMDLVPLCFELIPLYLTVIFKDGVEKEIDQGDAEGFPGHVCSMQKGPVFALADGLFPKPDVFVKQSAPCDSSNMSYQYAAKRFGIPLIVVDSPYYNNKRAFAYYLQEYKQMVAEVQRITGHRLEESRLREFVERGNRQVEFLYKLQDLRRHSPNPDPGLHRGFDLASLLNCGANEQFVTYMGTLYQEAKARVDNGTSFLPGDKPEIRTLWTWGMTAHMLWLSDWLEDQFGVTFLECGISNLPGEIVGLVDTSNLDSMIEGLAWRSFHFPMHRTVMGHSDIYVNDMLAVAQTYRADAAVFSGNQSCKHAWAAAKIISDVMEEEAGIPSLTWETDLIDKRFTPHATTKAQLSEFFQTLL